MGLIEEIAQRRHGAAERTHFLQLMQQCQICFEVDADLYVAPALLPAREAVAKDVQDVWC